jgi:5-formyltetrahydrofolate cyclo-ligase
MITDVQAAKRALRRDVRQRLKALAPESRLAASALICSRLEGQPIWRSARSVLLFASLPDEPDVWPLVHRALAEGKRVALPRFSSTIEGYEACQVRDPVADIRMGQFGIREPGMECPAVPLNELDVLLVPGVAFDLCGRRLGRGKGFYDRWLATAQGTTCGVAFEEQIVSEVPTERHDLHLSCILTPTRWVKS